MAKNLVIVESPAKAKTIEKFLGKDFTVKSSYGHVRDLSKKDMGVDIENEFQPNYLIPDDKKPIIKELKKDVKGAETIWLASDEDREGEAISWHLVQALKIGKNKYKRIVFHEITKSAITKAIENPRNIDENLVDAQQARRVLDRLVGFEISPVLWRKIKPSLSAGRVQTVAVRLIVEREREVEAFKPKSSYKVTAIFHVTKGKDKAEIRAELPKRFDKKADAKKFLQECIGSEFSIEKVETKPSKKTPAPPFTTSTLQQEASRKLGYSVAKTMQVAQSLYESGKITYMRTDSVNLSDYAIKQSKDEIETLYGAKYSKTRKYSTKTKGAQEAHEAIRPTFINKRNTSGNNAQQKLYELIWKRTVASQMSEAIIEKTTASINISKSKEKFTAKGEAIKFDGFLKVYMESTDEETEDSTPKGMLPPLKANDKLELLEATAVQRFSQHPPRYTEASLVKKLEELGIGRPSTYAPTISTIQKRGYVVNETREGKERAYDMLKLKDEEIEEEKLKEITGREKSKLFPTDIGLVVNDFLLKYFDNVFEYDFTARVEKEFDEIARGNKEWNEMIKSFYGPFHEKVETTLEKSGKVKGERLLGTDPKSGKNVYARIGRYGAMVQIGEREDEEKPKFAGLRKGQSIETITLEEALELFKLPREVGKYEDEDMVAAIGRFGPYIRHKGKFVSIPKTDDPLTIEKDRAIELIEAKREKDRQKTIKVFEDENETKILNGRWGPYISIGKENFKIPKEKKPEDLTLEECKKIVEESKKKKTQKKGTKKGSKK